MQLNADAVGDAMEGASGGSCFGEMKMTPRADIYGRVSPMRRGDW